MKSNDEEEQENETVQFSGISFLKKKDEPKQLDHVSSKFYIATEVC